MYVCVCVTPLAVDKVVHPVLSVAVSVWLRVCVLCGWVAEFDTTFVKPQNGSRNVTFIMQKVSKTGNGSLVVVAAVAVAIAVVVASK